MTSEADAVISRVRRDVEAAGGEPDWRARAEAAEARVRELGAALREHYLAGITCDHAREEDNPVCACSRVFLGWHPSVGAAVDAWIAHVLAIIGGGELPAPEEPSP